MDVEIKRLENRVHRYNIDSDRDLLIAAWVLCKTEYERYKTESDIAEHELKCKKRFDE